MNEILTKGFLGQDASLMLDVVVTALVLIVPWLIFSIYQVRKRRLFRVHKNHQLAMTLVLLVTVILFEVDMQLHGGWMSIVNKPGQTPRLEGEKLEFVRDVLYVHLIFAISTPILWVITVANALMFFRRYPEPGPHTPLHRFLGWASVIDLVCTSITGIAFYFLAFAIP